MKKSTIIIFFFLIFTTFNHLHAQWARTYGGDEDDKAYSIQQTSDGGYIVAGGTESFGAGLGDLWILKLDSNGNIEWQKTYGGSGGESGRSIQQTSDGGYIVAGHTFSFGDFWVLKLDSSGNIEWQRTYESWGRAFSIQQTTDGGYIVAGYTRRIMYGEDDLWILKLDSSGNIERQWRYGSEGADWVFSIQQTNDGGYIVAGRISLINGIDDEDAWILKLNVSGDIQWTRIYGSADYERAYSVMQTNDGGYIVVGEAAGSAWVLKLDVNGNTEWQRSYSEIHALGGVWSVQQTSDGGYIIAGDEAFVSKLDSSGNIEWARCYGSTGLDYAFSIQQTNDGGYIVAGDYFSFDAGNADLLVLKLYSDGDISQSCEIITSIDNAQSRYIDVPLKGTTIFYGETPFLSSATDCTIQDTDAASTILCEASNCTLTIISSIGEGGTTNPAPGSHSYFYKTEVQIEALPDDGYYFLYWSGDVPWQENNNPITIAMDSDKSIKANFSAIEVSGGKKGLCFIATSAYGSPLHPYVEVLRDFRDKYLISTKFGREFVELYYKYSPSAANLIAKHKPLRVIVQINLTPFVVFSYSMVHLGPIVTGGILLLILVLPIFFMSNLRKK